MSANIGNFIMNMVVVAVAIAAYGFDIMFFQIVFILGMAFAVHFAFVVLLASYRLGSMSDFAYLTMANDTDDSVMIFSQYQIKTRFLTYDVPFSLMLIYLGQPALGALYLGCLAAINLYFKELSELSR